ncbi:hypothetical protein C8R45DRAFT_1031687 [Mycena sanguinolenta]|nr:hypothetical protein C8R45DRAFT_1031687 [Mycena sanguinolenta]
MKALQLVLSVLCIRGRPQPLVQNFFKRFDSPSTLVHTVADLINVHVICQVLNSAEVHRGALPLTAAAAVYATVTTRAPYVLGFIDLTRHGQNRSF